MARERSQCPEKLLTQDDPRELMGQRQRAERQALVSVAGDCRVKPHRPTDQEGRRTRVVESGGAPRSERLARRRRLAAWRERHDKRAVEDAASNTVSLPAEHLIRAPLERLGRDLVDPKPDPLSDPSLVLPSCVRVGRARWADHDDLESWLPHGRVS